MSVGIYSNIEAVLNKRQPGDCPRTTNQSIMSRQQTLPVAVPMLPWYVLETLYRPTYDPRNLRLVDFTTDGKTQRLLL